MSGNVACKDQTNIVMRCFKVLILIAFNVACSPNNGSELSDLKSGPIDSSTSVNVKQKIPLADSTFVYKQFLDYDSVTGEYGDLDEPSVHDYWHEKNVEAVRYYKAATKLTKIPADQRMVFANYLYDAGLGNFVKDILATLNNRSDSTNVFYTMSSYGIPFKEFNIPEEVVKKYCPDIVYEQR